MRWTTIPLEYAAEQFISGGTPSTSDASFWDGDIPWITGADFNNDGVNLGRRTIKNDALINTATNLITKGSVLLVTRTGVGKSAIATQDIAISQDITGIVLKPGFNAKFVLYAIKSSNQILISAQRGATIKGVTRNVVKKLPIPFIAISEQNRIVEILDEADRLRRLRREADAKAARILPALFLKMFGDPATNPRGWPLGRIRDLAIKYSDGPFGSNLKSDHYVPNGVRVIRLQNIGIGRLIDTDKAFISLEHFNSISKHECRPGDVLVGTLGDPNLRACIQPDEIALALNKADCVQLRVNPDTATKEFVCWLINIPGTLSLAMGLVLGQTRSRISMGRLGELLVPVPPLRLQEKFSHKVQVVNSLLAKTDSACRKVDDLFNRLMERAFSGQLTAKWREARSKELLAEMEQQARLLNLPLPKELELGL